MKDRAMPKKNIILVIAVVALTIVIGISVINTVARVWEDLNKPAMLKTVYIDIPDDIVADAAFVRQDRPDGYIRWFDDFFEEEVEYLVKYMESNNLAIKPGRYEIRGHTLNEKALTHYFSFVELNGDSQTIDSL